MNNNLKKKLLNNKNDLIEGTFCYSLFEDAFFDVGLLDSLIEDAKEYISHVRNDVNIDNLLIWICQCVNQCFISHHNSNDYFFIKNYTPEIERKWVNNWEKKINALIEK